MKRRVIHYVIFFFFFKKKKSRQIIGVRIIWAGQDNVECFTWAGLGQVRLIAITEWTMREIGPMGHRAKRHYGIVIGNQLSSHSFSHDSTWAQFINSCVCIMKWRKLPVSKTQKKKKLHVSDAQCWKGNIHFIILMYTYNNVKYSND